MSARPCRSGSSHACAELLEQGNFTRVDPSNFHVILTKDSHYGLDLQVDVAAFEDVLIFYRGATTNTERHRDIRKAYLGWREEKVPVFQRLCMMFKLKPFDVRVREVMREGKVDRKEAEGIVKRLRNLLPGTVSSDYVYIKLFKNMPRSDVEMIFPNTKVKFRLFDKIKFGVTAGSGLGVGAIGTVSKIALASNPYTLVMALAGLGGVAVRQASAFINQRNRYMVVMARNLYFHSMADNRGVMTLLADRAAEEDIKEEMLLYSALAKQQVNIRDLKVVDHEIEQYLSKTFGIDVNFDDRRCAGTAQAGRHRHRARRRYAPDAASPGGGRARRQALGRVPRPDPRHGRRRPRDRRPAGGLRFRAILCRIRQRYGADA